ncbi:MAG: DHH family phosphoesterase [Halobacteriales archaeon]
MVRRLVLGCGSVGHTVIDDLAEWEGDTLVIDADETTVNALQEENIMAEQADQTDPAAITEFAEGVTTVFVAGDDPETNYAAVQAADTAFPTALVIAYSGHEPSADTMAALRASDARIIDHNAAMTTTLLDTVTGAGSERAWKLRQSLTRIDGKLAIVTHDNPDPDAIASALALREIAAAVGVEATIGYFGEISHQENRAFVNLLDISLTEFDVETFDPDDYAGIALVDHARAGVNDQLPEETPVDIVIDHHQVRAPIDAPFVDRRSAAGATSTLLVEYLRRLDIDITTTVATALLYGIRVDTKDFSREASNTDFEAAAFLCPWIDTSVLERIESPSVTADTFDTIARAIENRQQRGSIVVSTVGRINDRDTLAQAAEQLLQIEGIRGTLVCGIKNETIYLSARALSGSIDMGETLRRAFDQIGSAGGHSDMAGAQLPLGILGMVEEDDVSEVTDLVADFVASRFFETVETMEMLDPSLSVLTADGGVASRFDQS